MRMKCIDRKLVTTLVLQYSNDNIISFKVVSILTSFRVRKV